MSLLETMREILADAGFNVPSATMPASRPAEIHQLFEIKYPAEVLERLHDIKVIFDGCTIVYSKDEGGHA